MKSSEALLADMLTPGMRVAVSDGAGAPTAVLGSLTRIASGCPGLRLLLGWCLRIPDDFDPRPFAETRTMLGGMALRRLIENGSVEYVPTRLGSVPALVGHSLRADVVIASVRPGRDGWELGSEVAWTLAAARRARLVAVVNHGLPAASAEAPFPWNAVTVIGEVDEPPAIIEAPLMTPEIQQIGRYVVSLVPSGAVIQFGPGAVATATLRHLSVPVSVDSGLLTDDVVDLDRRGLLVGEPRATYLAGTPVLYEWANGRRILYGVEQSHRIDRLADRGIVAINAALEIDLCGQVNVETSGGAHVAGIGGHADFATAASRSLHGLSIIAVPTSRRGSSTLVDRLTGPASTARSDVDVVVTEIGIADLRGLGDVRRASALRKIWP